MRSPSLPHSYSRALTGTVPTNAMSELTEAMSELDGLMTALGNGGAK